MVLAMCGTLSAFAQDKIVTVSGKLIENDTQEPVEMAAVQLLSLPDSTQVAGVISQKQGLFTLPKVKPGRYVLRVSFIGYLTQNIPLQLTANAPTKNVGVISMATDAVMLSEAVVVAEAPPVTVKGDTTEFAASAYRVAEGSMLEDLVKKIPGAEVTSEGKITLNGKEIKKMLVDGKEFFSDDPAVAMKNLPAEMVEKVKAYDKKSDMARITGIDDGEEEAVLDLTVKKGMKQGLIGNLIAGYGSKERYEGGAMVSRFKDDSSFTLIGSTNNTNNRGFSEFGDAGQGMGGNAGSGITSSNSLGLNFAKQTKKLEMGGNLQYGYSDNDAVRKTSTENFLSDGTSSYTDAVNNSRRKRHDFRFDFRFEWKPDTLTTIIFRPGGSYSNTKSISGSASTALNNNRDKINDRTNSSSSDGDNYSLNGNFQLFRRLNSQGRNLSIGARFGYSDRESDVFSSSDSKFYELDSISSYERYTNNSGDSRNWSVSASYTEPVFRNHFLELRYEYAHRKQVSQSLVYDSIEVYRDYLNRGYDNSLSSRVENFYNSHTVDLSLRANYEKLQYNLGVSLTPQSSKSDPVIGPNMNNDPVKQNVMNWAPSAMLRYRFNKQHFLMFRYRGRSNAPNAEDLQEVIDVTDPMNLRYGDPNLKPSFTNNLMMFWNKFIPESMRSYSANVFYMNTLNSVANKMTYDPSTGARTYQKVNINGNWNARGFFSFNTPFKNKKFTLSSNTNARYSDAVSYTSVGSQKDANQVLSTTHSLGAGERLTTSYRSDLFDISLNGEIRYDLTRNGTNKDNNRETFDYIFGGSTNWNLPWRLFVSTDLNCRLKDGYSEGFNNTEVIWNAQISKNIFKKSQGTLRLKVYDILGQQSNLSRTISESMMTDTEVNTLGSYCMVHFVYRFNTLGGKRPSGGRGMGGDRRGPGGWGGPGGGPGGFGGGRPF